MHAVKGMLVHEGKLSLIIHFVSNKNGYTITWHCLKPIIK